jgi:hypothetical protein
MTIKIEKKQPHSAFLLTLFFLLSGTPVFAELPPVDEESNLRQKYHEVRTAKQQTIEAPLAGSILKVELKSLSELTLGGQKVTSSHTPNLKVREIGSRAVHISFEPLTDAAAYTWNMAAPKNFKDRWFRLRYSGSEIPAHVLLSVHSQSEAAPVLFDLYPAPSQTPAEIIFKLPAGPMFDKTTSLSLVMDPKLSPAVKGSFVLLELDTLPPDHNPLASNARVDTLPAGNYGLISSPKTA